MQEIFDIVASRVSDNGSCVRLFHGRGKKWPRYSHLSIDFYPPIVLVTTYKEMSLEEKEEMLHFLSGIPGLSFEALFLQKRYARNEAIEVLLGEFQEKALAVEKSEKYELNFKNANVGFFLDMALGREVVRKLAENKRVLNLFSYTCSLSVAALRGGASEVINIDMSKAALLVGEKNHELNGVLGKAKFIPYDIMNSFANIRRKGPYDLVIIDPPTNQGESFKVSRDYYKIVRKLGEMTTSGAWVLACLNAPLLRSSFLVELFKEHAPEFSLEETFYSAFSEMEVDPEEGLKILLFKKRE